VSFSRGLIMNARKILWLWWIVIAAMWLFWGWGLLTVGALIIVGPMSGGLENLDERWLINLLTAWESLPFVLNTNLVLWPPFIPLLFGGLSILLIAYKVVGRKKFNRALEAALRRQNLCLKCWYDLRGSEDKCPECGTIIPP